MRAHVSRVGSNDDGADLLRSWRTSSLAHGALSMGQCQRQGIERKSLCVWSNNWAVRQRVLQPGHWFVAVRFCRAVGPHRC